MKKEGFAELKGFLEHNGNFSDDDTEEILKFVNKLEVD